MDGGVLAKVSPEGKLIHLDWRVHAVGPDRPCMVCVGNLDLGDVALDYEGKLDDPVYIVGLDKTLNLPLSKQNVFAFSMSVAAHEVLQFVGLVTRQRRVGASGPQIYHAYPGEMEVLPIRQCRNGCGYHQLTGRVHDLTGNLKASNL